MNNTIDHVFPTEFFLGTCENGCDNHSVRWSEKSQQFLCWSCLASPGYKVAAYMFTSR